MILCSSETRRFSLSFIKGKKADSITWTFQIPDSLYKTTASFEILPKPFDWNTNTTFKASFIATINGKDLYTYQLTLDEESSFSLLHIRTAVQWRIFS